MKRVIIRAFAVVISLAIGDAMAASRYTLTELGIANPEDINSSGQIAGNLRVRSGAALLMPGAYSMPIELGFDDKSAAFSINSFGQIALQSNYNEKALLWTPYVANGDSGTAVDLGDINAPALSEGNYTHDISDIGSVVGYGWDFYGTGAKSYVWSPSSPNAITGSLSSIGGGSGKSVVPLGINSRGNIAGGYVEHNQSFGAERAFVFRPTEANGVTGSMAFLDLIEGGKGSRAEAINNVGQIVGSVELGSTRHAFLWNPNVTNGTLGSMLDLGILPTKPATRAVDVNSHGTVIGIAGPVFGGGSDDLSFVWTAEDGMRDLSSLLGESGAGWRLYGVTSINDRGQIVGTGEYDPDGPGGIRESFRGFVAGPGTRLRLFADAGDLKFVAWRAACVTRITFNETGAEASPAACLTPVFVVTWI